MHVLLLLPFLPQVEGHTTDCHAALSCPAQHNSPGELCTAVYSCVSIAQVCVRSGCSLAVPEAAAAIARVIGLT
jgi:hypothetical protein